MRNHKGFTLIEILIALAIFAIMATVTSLTLMNIFNIRTRLKTHADYLANLQTGYHLFQQDLSLVAKRFIYDTNRNRQGVFVGNLDSFNFYRRMSYTGEQPHVHLVNYRIDKGRFIRTTYNPAVNKPLYHQTLFQELENVELKYLDQNGYYRDKWFTAQQPLLPKALLIRFSLKNAGSVEWIIKIQNDTAYEIAQKT